MVQHWRRKETNLKALENSKTMHDESWARLTGAGQWSQFEDIEDQLFQWVVREQEH